MAGTDRALPIIHKQAVQWATAVAAVGPKSVMPLIDQEVDLIRSLKP